MMWERVGGAIVEVGGGIGVCVYDQQSCETRSNFFTSVHIIQFFHVFNRTDFGSIATPSIQIEGVPDSSPPQEGSILGLSSIFLNCFVVVFLVAHIKTPKPCQNLQKPSTNVLLTQTFRSLCSPYQSIAGVHSRTSPSF